MWQDFSDRIGVTESSDAVQIGGMSESLRNRLWNLLLRTLFSNLSSELTSSIEIIWDEFFKRCIDDLYDLVSPGERISIGFRGFFKRKFLSKDFSWYQVYNLIEFLARNSDRMVGIQCESFEVRVNTIMRQEHSGYRFVGAKLVPISGEQEMESIGTAIAMTQAGGFFGSAQHLEAATDLLAKKPEPDYRNSIKESISAVESLVMQITGEENFSRAIADLDTEIGFHGGFKSALRSLYGYSSDEDGIRHAILEEKDVGFDEAKFMLVICSALVNFVVSKASTHRLIETRNSSSSP